MTSNTIQYQCVKKFMVMINVEHLHYYNFIYRKMLSIFPLHFLMSQIIHQDHHEELKYDISLDSHCLKNIT